MKRIHPGKGVVVFIVFFGLALLDSVRSIDWIRLFFWTGIGAAFLLADRFKKQEGNN